MKYQILITYDTGDSFHQENDVETHLDGDWAKYEVAVENLNRIREHYQYTKALTGYHFTREDKKTAKQIIQDAPKQRWYREQYSDHSLNLITDDGVEYACSAFWTGYFENLVGAEIVQELAKFRA